MVASLWRGRFYRAAGLAAVVAGVALCSAAAPAPAFAAAEAADVTRALFDYVHKGDDASKSYYDERLRTRQKGVDLRLYTVHSQVWQGRDLFNQLYTAIPAVVDPSQIRHVLLIVTGGSFRDRLFEPATEIEKRRFVDKANRYLPLIKRMNTAAIVVRHVPFQRMKLCEDGHPRGQKEDALIACSLQKYLATGDPSWPLLFPMTKTVKVNMDIAEEIFRTQWGAQIETFTVIGASKRGWTTHMISIVDDRVTATIPIVINMLNMPEYIAHAERVWGEHSPQIRDYVDRGILKHSDTELGARMLAMIDPYTYREYLDHPKLLIYGTNDPYWPVDSTRHYVADLPGETRLLFLPNQGHDAKRSALKLLAAASKAMHTRAATDKPLASLTWRYEVRNDALNIAIETDVRPRKIEYWSADSSDRDFRNNKWSKRVLCGPRTLSPWTWLRKTCRTKTVADVPVSNESCRAQFAQVFFRHDGFARYPNSTDISVTGPLRCVATPERSHRTKQTAGI